MGQPGPDVQRGALRLRVSGRSLGIRGSPRCGLRPRGGGLAGRARVPHRLRGRVLAVGRQHLRVRPGARLLRRARRYQHRVLFYGILGALVFRAIFISLGAVLASTGWRASSAPSWCHGASACCAGPTRPATRPNVSDRAPRAAGEPCTGNASSCGRAGGCRPRRCFSRCFAWRRPTSSSRSTRSQRSLE